MAVAEWIGWAATALGVVLALPQLLRLIRTRSVEGLSLVAWQMLLCLNLAWTAHGISIGQLPQILTNSLALFTTVPILVLMARELGRPLLPTMLPSVVLALVMIAIDQFFGSAAFGIVAIAPSIVVSVGQSVELVRAEHVRGVSPISLSLAVVNLLLWVVWGNLVNDSGTVIAVGITFLVAAFNLVWYLLRLGGLRPFFARVRVPAVVPVVVEADAGR